MAVRSLVDRLCAEDFEHPHQHATLEVMVFGDQKTQVGDQKVFFLFFLILLALPRSRSHIESR